MGPMHLNHITSTPPTTQRWLTGTKQTTTAPIDNEKGGLRHTSQVLDKFFFSFVFYYTNICLQLYRLQIKIPPTWHRRMMRGGHNMLNTTTMALNNDEMGLRHVSMHHHQGKQQQGKETARAWDRHVSSPWYIFILFYSHYFTVLTTQHAFWHIQKTSTAALTHLTSTKWLWWPPQPL